MACLGLSEKTDDGVKPLDTPRLAEDELLFTHSHFKQVTGAADREQPGMLDLQRKAVWGSCNRPKDTSKESNNIYKIGAEGER